MTAVDLEHLPVRADESDEPNHVVCHCTNYEIAWCRLDVSDTEFGTDDDELDCPLCNLVSETSPETCPWGCSCGDEC